MYSTLNAVVDLQAATCSCCQWQIMGPQCIHAPAVIFNKLRGAYQYVDGCYHTSDYIRSYGEPIIPFVSPHLIPMASCSRPQTISHSVEDQRGREFNQEARTRPQLHLAADAESLDTTSNHALCLPDGKCESSGTHGL